MKNSDIMKICLMLIITINGAYIAAGSTFSFLHYLVGVGFGLPLAYGLGKESK